MRILFLTHRLPYAPNRGDRIRAYHMLRVLSQDHEVDLVSLVHDAEERSQTRHLENFTSSVYAAPVPRLRNWVAALAALPGPTPLTHLLLHSPDVRPYVEAYVRQRAPDVVLAYCSSMARYALERPLRDIPCVLDLVDVDSRKWHELAEKSTAPRRWIYRREADRLQKFERRAMRRAYATLVVSERERMVAEQLGGATKLLTVPIGVDLAYFAPREPPSTSHDVIFCGVFNYEPNELGAVWLATEVWPRVLRSCPKARLKLVGMNPSRRVQALAHDPSIQVTGAVADIRPYLWGAAVATAPVSISRGTQTKVLEAVAAGLPCVVTPEVMGGLPEATRSACWAPTGAQEFSDALLTWLSMDALTRRAIAAQADLTALSWERRLHPLVEVLHAAAGRESPSSDKTSPQHSAGQGRRQ